jgi:hypothetical protein
MADLGIGTWISKTVSKKKKSRQERRATGSEGHIPREAWMVRGVSVNACQHPSQIHRTIPRTPRPSLNKLLSLGCAINWNKSVNLLLPTYSRLWHIPSCPSSFTKPAMSVGASVGKTCRTGPTHTCCRELQLRATMLKNDRDIMPTCQQEHGVGRADKFCRFLLATLHPITRSLASGCRPLSARPSILLPLAAWSGPSRLCVQSGHRSSIGLAGQVGLPGS